MSQTQHAGLAFREVDEVGKDKTKDRKDKRDIKRKLSDAYPGHQEAMKSQGHMKSACKERFPSLADYRVSTLFSTAVPSSQSPQSSNPISLPKMLFSTCSRKASWHTVLSTKAPIPKQDLQT